MERQPGPQKRAKTYKCPACGKNVCKSQASVCCATCPSWAHLSCTGLAALPRVPGQWSCSACVPAAPPSLPPLPSQPTRARRTAGQRPPSRSGAEPPPARAPPPSCYVCSRPIYRNHKPVACATCPSACHKKCFARTAAGLCPPCASKGGVGAASASRPLRPLQTLTVLQLNVNGVRCKLPELVSFLHELAPDVACLQESKLHAGCDDPAVPGYSVLRRDRGAGGGGLLTLVREGLPHTLALGAVGDGVAELLAVDVSVRGPAVRVLNVYIPPRDSCPANYRADFGALLRDDCERLVVVGDFNAHHPSWYSSQDSDDRGEALLVESGSLVVLNGDEPTRLPLRGRPTSPDISLCSPALAPSAVWQVRTRLSSDHLPITCTFGLARCREERRTRTFLNFRKADWPLYAGLVEDGLRGFLPEQFPTPIAAARALTSVLTKASRRCVPAGRVPRFKPCSSPELRALIAERDALRTLRHDDAALPALNSRVAELSGRLKREAFERRLSDATIRDDPARFWSLLRSLAPGRLPSAGGCALRSGGRIFSTNPEKAEVFARVYHAVGSPPRGRLRRQVARSLRRLTLSAGDAPFSVGDVEEELKEIGSSRALGPDGLADLHLRHLGPVAATALHRLFSALWSRCAVPGLWKTATVVPLPKAGKALDSPGDFRPIALLSPLAKLMERLILRSVAPALPLAAHQHGFRAGHSTSTALSAVVEFVVEGFNRSKPCDRSLLAQLDFSRAYDTVYVPVVLRELGRLDLPTSTVRWIAAFLNGRTSRVRVGESCSRPYSLRAGVPQGSVLAPALFNLVMSTAPAPARPLELVTYADDLSALSRARDFRDAAPPLQRYLDAVAEWSASAGLRLSAGKCTRSLFTTDPCEVNLPPPPLSAGGVDLVYARNPRVLGVTLSPDLSASAHVRDVAARATARCGFIKALTGHGAAVSVEDRIVVYKTFVRPVIDYAAQSWCHLAGDSHLGLLQRVQNTCLRAALGATASTPTAHLHNESRVVDVRAHLQLKACQHQLRVENPTHPCHALSVPRPARRHAYQRGPAAAADLLRRALANRDPSDPGPSLRALHAVFTAQSLARLPRPAEAPDGVDESERELPDAVRRRLSQLRSGHCALLRSYAHRIGLSPDPSCPRCGARSETSPHLFSCPGTATLNADQLSYADLWRRPVLAARFLLASGVLSL